MRLITKTGLLAAILALPLAATHAQTIQPVPATPPPTGRNATQVPPERMASPEATTSEKLSRSNGTITPPDVDPGMATKPPAIGGAMPVIPPPGAPGGASGVRPK